ncbi:Tigger transposable element-derived protein 1-like [Oopsacas minuta]|uniref:Tigger transposable element-derived protein 1-like n=1 Tax=Oopsacas minuta TaxID=111878 RepID=A0AAV7JGJ9_9METZ|nr:Tigger transposable element-derived protein 1-like [Oopsacas minuta]
MERGQLKRKFLSYTLEFQLEAVHFVTSGNSKEEAARKYGVDCKRVREWCINKDKLKDSCEAAHNAKRRRLDGGSRPPSFETLEESLYSWIEDLRSQRLRVTRKMVQGKALELYAGEEESFVASRGWLRNFFGRHNITLRRRTTVGQKIPETVIPKLMNYIIFVRSQIPRNRYQLSHIGAMDATPIWFSCLPIQLSISWDINLSQLGQPA